jgi:hypothetical protein
MKGLLIQENIQLKLFVQGLHKAKNNIMQMHLLAHNGGFFHDLV